MVELAFAVRIQLPAHAYFRKPIYRADLLFAALRDAPYPATSKMATGGVAVTAKHSSHQFTDQIKQLEIEGAKLMTATTNLGGILTLYSTVITARKGR